MSNKETIYNKRMKVADLLANDGSLLSILQRLDIKLGFGEATVAELCARYNISAELFLIRVVISLCTTRTPCHLLLEHFIWNN